MLADTLVARALECDGLSYGNPATRRAFLLHQYPGDVTPDGEPNAAAHQMGASQWGCLLHCRGVLAGDEVDGVVTWRGQPLDVLRCAYADPKVFTRIDGLLYELGRQRGLLVTSGDELGDIEPGDIIVHGYGGSPSPESAAYGGVAHGIFVTGVDGTRVESVDGGQHDPLNAGHGSLIKRIERQLTKRNGHWWLGSRRIAWRLRAGALPCL